MIKYIRYICFLFVVIFCTESFCATLSMSSNKQTVAEGDVFLLTITYEDNQKDANVFNQVIQINNLQSGDLNLNVFNKDFDIVSKSVSSQNGFYNGDLTTKKIWKIGLKPKRSGKITIEPIKIGDAISNYVDIEVKETTDVSYVPDSHSNSNAPYFKIEQTIDNKKPYVQQQVTFLVKVYDNIGLKNGTINIKIDSFNDWFLTPLMNEPIIKKEVVNNKTMNAYYFAYAGFPQKSGEISLPQFVFDGAYIKGNNFDFTNIDDDMAFVGSLFSNLVGQTVPVKMQTKAEKIYVQPIPSNYTAKNWLPLKDLKITASWPKDVKFKVGEAVNRVITISANGLHSSYFPQIDFNESKDIKQYPEKPIISEQINNASLLTTATINNVYIPQKEGEFILPAIVLEWFNTESNKIEKSFIPEEKIIVNSGYISTDETVSIIDHKESTNNKTIEIKEKTESELPYTLFLYILFGLFFILLLIVIFRYFRKKNMYYKMVINSLKRFDYKKTKDNLLLWGKNRFCSEDINNLHDLAELVNCDEFTNQLLLLNKILYSHTDENFDIRKFIEIFKKVDRMRKRVKTNNDILPKLYN